MLRWLLIALAVYIAWRALNARPASDERQTPPASADQPMVRCARCRVHVPEQRATHANGTWYCCPEHRDEVQP